MNTDMDTETDGILYILTTWSDSKSQTRRGAVRILVRSRVKERVTVTESVRVWVTASERE